MITCYTFTSLVQVYHVFIPIIDNSPSCVMAVFRMCNRIAIASVHDVFRPFYRFAQPFGLVCFQQRNGKFVATTSCANVVCLLLNCAICAAGLFSGMLSRDSGENGSQMLNHGFKFTYVCTAVSQLVGNINALRYRYQVVDLLQHLENIDEQLAIYKIRQDHWLHYRLVCMGCIYTALVIMSIAAGSVWAASTVCDRPFWLNAIGAVISAYVTISYCTILGGNVLGLLGIRLRIEALNETIGSRDARTDVWTVQRLARIGDTLNNCCDQLNACYSMSTVVCIGSAFVTNIVYMFSMYTYVSHAPHLPIVWLALLSLIWNFHIQIWPVMLAHAGDELVTAGRRTGQQIHRQLNELCDDRSTAVERQLEHFSQQVLHRRPVAHTRLFAVDWTMVFAVSIRHVY